MASSEERVQVTVLIWKKKVLYAAFAVQSPVKIVRKTKNKNLFPKARRRPDTEFVIVMRIDAIDLQI